MNSRIPTIAALLLFHFGNDAFGKDAGVFVNGEGNAVLACTVHYPSVDAEKANIEWFLMIGRYLSDVQRAGPERPQLKVGEKVREIGSEFTYKRKDVHLLTFWAAAADAYKICITMDSKGITVESAR